MAQREEKRRDRSSNHQLYCSSFNLERVFLLIERRDDSVKNCGPIRDLESIYKKARGEKETICPLKGQSEVARLEGMVRLLGFFLCL